MKPGQLPHCVYCGVPSVEVFCSDCLLAFQDEYDQARWAEESSSIKPGEVRDPAHDETPPE